MVSVSSLSAADLPEVRRLHNRFTASSVDAETVEAWYDDDPQLFVGAYADGDLVGYCLGIRRGDDRVELHGIGVQPTYRRDGIGSRLVEAFEERVRRTGAERISVGSAGGYVVEFYEQNGFSAESVLVRLAPEAVPDEYQQLGYDVVEERREGDVRKLYVDADEVDFGFISEVRSEFGDPDAIYIMGKSVE